MTKSPFRRPTLESMPTDSKPAASIRTMPASLREAKARGFDNALVCDALGNVAETGTSNVFLAKDGAVHTPAPNGTFLNGITRQRVIQLLRDDGVDVVEGTLRYEDFLGADEIFISGNYSKVCRCCASTAAISSPARSTARRASSTGLSRTARLHEWFFTRPGEMPAGSALTSVPIGPSGARTEGDGTLKPAILSVLAGLVSPPPRPRRTGRSRTRLRRRRLGLDRRRRTAAAAQGLGRRATSREVLDAISDGASGAIAVAFMEWGGPQSQVLIVDWHVIRDAASARVFADTLMRSPRGADGYNSISNAIDFSVRLVETNAHEGKRKVIDVSATGPTSAAARSTPPVPTRSPRASSSTRWRSGEPGGRPGRPGRHGARGLLPRRSSAARAPSSRSPTRRGPSRSRRGANS